MTHEPEPLNATEKYWQAFTGVTRGSRLLGTQLLEAADEWRNQNQRLASALALHAVPRVGLGCFTGEELHSTALQAIEEFDCAHRAAHPGSPAALLSLFLSSRCVTGLSSRFGYDSRLIRRTWQGLSIRLQDEIVRELGGGENASQYIVKGVTVSGDVTGPWSFEFSTEEVNPGVSSRNWVERRLSFNIPSAFMLAVRIGDFSAAHSLFLTHAEHFDTPRLLGWHFAVEAFVTPSRAPELFAEAARHFDSDIVQLGKELRHSWSSESIDLWAPHFRSRGHLARIGHDPDRAVAHLQAALGDLPERPRFVDANVGRFGVLVRTLAGLLDIPGGCTPEEARAALEQEVEITGDLDVDPPLRSFIESAVAGLEALKTNRRTGFSQIGRAFEALNRMPLLASEADSVAIETLLDRSVVEILDGESQIWIHRTLQSITDERVLQRVMLRVFQQECPLFAQVRHGALEYGMDIVVVRGKPGGNVLRSYQVKVGEIKKGSWAGIRQQLDEMFYVPLSDLQLPAYSTHEGVLLWNAHVNPYIEPVIEGWRNDQARVQGRVFEFMHLDRIVNYVLDNRLVSALREALAEEGVEIVNASSSP